MSRVIGQYSKIIMYFVFGIIIVLSLYMIISNIRHYEALSKKIVVTEADYDYVQYKKNINEIEELLKTKQNNVKYRALNSTLTILKNGGVFRLLPNSKIGYRELSELNDYFLNDIINECWITNFNSLNNVNNNEMVKILTNNSNYLANHFINNGITIYDNSSDDIIREDYDMILKNYLSFSNIILSLSKS